MTAETLPEQSAAPETTGGFSSTGRGSGGVHPIVRLDYLVRVPACPIVLLTVASVLYHGQKPITMWVLTAAYGLLWPHLAFWVASRAKDSKAAELRNLLVDTFLQGCFVAFMSFNVLPSIVLVTSVNAANLSVGGIKYAARGIVAIMLGVLVGGWYAGFVFSAESHLLTSTISIIAIVTYTTIFGLHSHMQTKRAMRIRKQLLDQKVQVEEQNRRVEEQSRSLEEQNRRIEAESRAAEEARAAAEEAREAATQASRAKSAFLANMSHELRTPLNAIIGYSEMLCEDAEDLGYGDFVPDLKKIQTAGKHLLDLINSVLDLSKIEAGKMGLFLETLDLANLARDVAVTAEPLIQKKGNQFVVDVQEGIGTLKGDSTKLRQILLNLLSNAAKFTENGTVTLRMRREFSWDGAWVEMTVRDTGIGMSASALEKVFEPFTQADGATTRKYGGTGLGLTICRRFAQMMGGDITVTSEPGSGSAFTVLLPGEVSNEDGEATSIRRRPSQMREL